MTLQAIHTKQFEKDVKKIIKRGKKLSKLKAVIEALLNSKKLSKQYRDHKLLGKYINRRECHIEPDWLLIYKLGMSSIIFERTGTHADLFR